MTREALFERVHALIRRLSDGSRDDRARDELLRDMLVFQKRQIPAYNRLCAARATREPGLPTDVFRFARIASHPKTEDCVLFRTSGTTHGTRGVHAFRTLDLYDLAAQSAARYALFPDVARMPLVMLAPRAEDAKDSSLSYMLSRFASWFGSRVVWAWSDHGLDLDTLERSLLEATRAEEPIALLGTSFALVHACDELSERRFSVPAGSRIMQTGGYKGRSRELAPSSLRALLTQTFGVAEPYIVAEYGMTEMSSQFYELTLREATLEGSVSKVRPASERRLWNPGWTKATPVHPETLEPVHQGEHGILRIDDLANLDSVAAIQTSDLAAAFDDGIELLGRDPSAAPRGCSLATEEALDTELVS